MDIELLRNFTELEAGYTAEAMLIKCADEIESLRQQIVSLSSELPAKPEVFWNKGDEYVMQSNDEVSAWAADNDYVHGESFDLEYSVTGKATFIVDGDSVELTDYSPKYYTAPSVEFELLKNDAQRYRCLRSCDLRSFGLPCIAVQHSDHDGVFLSGEDADKVVDQAIAINKMKEKK